MLRPIADVQMRTTLIGPSALTHHMLANSVASSSVSPGWLDVVMNRLSSVPSPTISQSISSSIRSQPSPTTAIRDTLSAMHCSTKAGSSASSESGNSRTILGSVGIGRRYEKRRPLSTLKRTSIHDLLRTSSLLGMIQAWMVPRKRSACKFGVRLGTGSSRLLPDCRDIEGRSASGPMPVSHVESLGN